MKGKISKATLLEISTLPPELLEAHGIITKANSAGYICPECGNGTGSSGTGIEPLVADLHVGWKCLRCGEKFDNIGILARHFELDRRKNFLQLIEKICAEFNLALNYDNFDVPQVSRKSARKKAKDKPVDEFTLRMIEADLNESIMPLKKLLEAVKTWRGLPFETLEKFKCRLNWQWTPPDKRTQNFTPTGRMIIPCSKQSYLARMIEKVDNLPIKCREFFRGKEKMHAGRKSLFNAKILKSADCVFAVEGYIDAMSIDYAGFASVALGGADCTELLTNALDKLENPPRVIILLDNDLAGQNAARKLYQGLIALNCPAVVRFLSEPSSEVVPTDSDCISAAAKIITDEKVDANSILVDEGVAALRDKLNEIINDSLAEFTAIEEVVKERKANRISDETLTAIFDGNDSDMNYAERLEIYRGDRIRWLTDSEKWLTYDIDNGVWKRGTEKNSCVGHFAFELSKAMIEHAQTQDERKLAEKFQSAKKIGAAIGLLKDFPTIRITADDLDKHGELLNVGNGVIDLTNATFYEHDDYTRQLLLTQRIRADYDANAKSELVEKFFSDIMPNEETRAGLLRFLGHCLTAETREDKFAIWQGGGANGKSTLTKLLIELFGDYATGLSPFALIRNRGNGDADKATTSLNPIEGKRLSISEEIPSTAELNSELIKDLSGGDKINLRRNFGEYRTIDNHSKFIICGNYLPRLDSVADDGIQRRLLNFPFTVKFGEGGKPIDRQLKQKLLEPENLRALLALLIREARAWYEEGLIISDEMHAETSKYLAQNDFVDAFIEEYYERGDNLSVKAKDFVAHLKAKYPRETSRFQRADLIKMIEKAGHVTYCTDNHRNKIFKGIERRKDADFDGEPVDAPPFR